MYQIEYAASVAKDLRRLSREIQQRAMQFVEHQLASDPRVGLPLKGSYRGLWKYRIGEYRIVYKIEAERVTVLVLRIRHRKDVYR